MKNRILDKILKEISQKGSKDVRLMNDMAREAFISSNPRELARYIPESSREK